MPNRGTALEGKSILVFIDDLEGVDARVKDDKVNGWWHGEMMARALL